YCPPGNARSNWSFRTVCTEPSGNRAVTVTPLSESTSGISRLRLELAHPLVHPRDRGEHRAEPLAEVHHLALRRVLDHLLAGLRLLEVLRHHAGVAAAAAERLVRILVLVRVGL